MSDPLDDASRSLIERIDTELRRPPQTAGTHLVGGITKIGSKLEAFLALANGSLQNARDLGAHDALTGPASRGDWSTVARHLGALPSDERDLYRTLARAASRLADRPFPPDLDR